MASGASCGAPSSATLALTAIPKILVVNASSRRMNPTLSEAIVARAYDHRVKLVMFLVAHSDTVLTDNGMAFTDLPKNCQGPSCCFLGPHIFDRVCMANAIEHRFYQALPPGGRTALRLSG